MNAGNNDSFPYNVWSTIARIGDYLQNDNVNLEIIGEILDQLKNLPSWTPDKYAEQYSAVDDYKRFNTWLLGQLIGIQLRENLTQLHEKCLRVQVTLLQQLHDINLILYQNALGRYICLFKEVCDTLSLGHAEAEQRLFVFNWSSERFMDRPEIELGLNGCSQLSECVNFIITLFIMLDHQLSVDFYVEILSLLWECALILLRTKKEHAEIAKIRAYRFIAYLLCDSSSSELPDFNGMMTVLLEHIMADVSNVCQTGKLSNE